MPGQCVRCPVSVPSCCPSGTAVSAGPDVAMGVTSPVNYPLSWLTPLHQQLAFASFDGYDMRGWFWLITDSYTSWRRTPLTTLDDIVGLYIVYRKSHASSRLFLNCLSVSLLYSQINLSRWSFRICDTHYKVIWFREINLFDGNRKLLSERSLYWIHA